MKRDDTTRRPVFSPSFVGMTGAGMNSLALLAQSAGGAGFHAGSTAVTSISTLAWVSTSAATCTQVIAGKFRPMTSR